MLEILAIVCVHLTGERKGVSQHVESRGGNLILTILSDPLGISQRRDYGPSTCLMKETWADRRRQEQHNKVQVYGVIDFIQMSVLASVHAKMWVIV